MTAEPSSSLLSQNSTKACSPDFSTRIRCRQLLSSYTSLPYDIRNIIHSYLASGKLLAPKVECSGLYWSCTKIRDELDEFVCVQLRVLCATIRNDTGGLISFQRDVDDLRYINVLLPHTAFEHQVSYSTHFSPQMPLWRWSWRREILSILHPFFAFHFETLRITITSQPSAEEEIPWYNKLTYRCFVFANMRGLVHDIGNMIEYTNTYNKVSDSVHASFHHPFTFFLKRHLNNTVGPVDPFPRAEVIARRICLTWDFRTAHASNADLIGKLVYGKRPSISVLRQLMHQVTLVKRYLQGAPSDPLDPPYDQSVMAYYLRGKDRLIGEIGIVSLTRWRLKDPRDPLVTNMVRMIDIEVNGVDIPRGVAITSEGLGKRVNYGLAKEEMRLYKEEQNRRRWERDCEHNDETYRAYIEDGYMMY